jgi:hypothetical protein
MSEPAQDQNLDHIHEMDIDGDGDTEPISERDPVELAQMYIDEAWGNSGWKVDEISGNVDFGMVTVILGRYDESEDQAERIETAEGHGTSIPAAVDDAMGSTATNVVE